MFGNAFSSKQWSESTSLIYVRQQIERKQFLFLLKQPIIFTIIELYKHIIMFKEK